ncbi:hypothetical protein D3C77_701640 [compost metagenome]
MAGKRLLRHVISSMRRDPKCLWRELTHRVFPPRAVLAWLLAMGQLVGTAGYDTDYLVIVVSR